MDDTIMNGRCVSIDRPWSIIESSLPNAQLAGVLAGFMLSGIVFLLSREKDDKEPAPTHTIALFFAGVLILGLNSYLFGSIASIRPPTRTTDAGIEVVQDGAKYVCAIVWTQGMAASGMLAVGGTVMVAGIGWTITQFAKSRRITSRFFLSLGNIITGIIIATTLLLLTSTARTFLDTAIALGIDAESGSGIKTFVTWVAIVGAVCCSVLVAWRTVAMVVNIHSTGRWHNEADANFHPLALASLLTAVLAFLGPFFARLLGERRELGEGTVWFAVTLCVFLPTAIYLAIAYSVPGSWNSKGSNSQGGIWMRLAQSLIFFVGFVLIGLVVWKLSTGAPDDGSTPLLMAGVLLLIVGPLLDRLREFELSATKAKAIFAALSAAESEVAEGEVEQVEVRKSAPVQGDPAGSPTVTLAPVPEEESVPPGKPATPRVLITAGAQKAIDALDPSDKELVAKAIEQMLESPNDADAWRLRGSREYWVRRVSDNIRLVYRLLDRRSKDDPGGYVILNVIRPGSTLWKFSEY